MAAIVNDVDVLLQAAGTRLLAVALPPNVTVPNAQVSGLGALATQSVVDFATQVTGAQKPANNADVTTSILTNSGTAIVMTSSALFKSSSGIGGVFIGSGGLIGKDGSGVTTFSINATTGAAYYGGDISGGSNITTTGQATFNGVSATNAGINAAVNANASHSSPIGVYAETYGYSAIYGWGRSGGGFTPGGVVGISDNSVGVSGVTSGAGSYGGSFSNSAGGAALNSANGFKWGSYTYAVPTGSATAFMRADGTWADLTSLIKLISSGNATAGAALGYLVIDTYGAAGQVKIPYYAL